MKTELISLNLSELEALVQKLGQPKFRGKQIYEWLYKGAESFDDMKNLPKDLRQKLSEEADIGTVKISEKFVSKIDETRKYLLQLKDGNYVEAVLMKYEYGYTICISTQVGCKMGCKFCASTIGGKERDLTAGELLSQIICVQKDLGQRISNIVMMGIGEPLDNFDNVLKFIELVNAPGGLNIGQRHISLSTCGLVDKMRDLADRQLQITLLISLHAPNNEKRSAIMPINKKYSIEEVLSACDYYIEKTGRRISFEYTLISGVNDSVTEADELATLLCGKLCHVNLIPVNKVEETGFEKGDKARIEAFRKQLEKRGIQATVRREMGSDINAACGQLRKKKNIELQNGE
ncbi:MAG: 23S rRNA (adenine(2503)-C(2))-methyltransferase RlmN [Ruminococcaceae bacterium]|nr:23S rRNA (adenine(2503)-C(2))-methyltransferase RlmN [Oscillospiraceae bacterium]